MDRVEGPASSARSRSWPVALRQLWDAGRHVAVIRIALRDWGQLLTHIDDVGWVQDELRRSGLEADAFALQVERCRRRRDTRDWEALIASVLHFGDPWWARELLEEAPAASRELERLRIETEIATGDAAE